MPVIAMRMRRGAAFGSKLQLLAPRSVEHAGCRFLEAPLSSIMPELSDIRSGCGDCRVEREHLKKAADFENDRRAILERHTRDIAMQCADLELKVAEKQEELQMKRHAAEAEIEQAERRGDRDVKSLTMLWPEVEEAKAAFDRMAVEVDQKRQLIDEQHEAHHERLEVSRSIYQMYTSCTGIHWDHQSTKVEGYVAFKEAKHFEVGDVPRGAAARQDTADALWREIEAALPPDSDEDTASTLRSAVPGGA